MCHARPYRQLPKTITESALWRPSAQETSSEGMHHRHRRLIGTQRRTAMWSTLLGDPCPRGCMTCNRLRLSQLVNEITNTMDTTITLPRSQADLCGSAVEVIAC